jgi:hypothetical protein
MARKVKSVTVVSCDHENCNNILQITTGTLSDYDWGIIRLFDNKVSPEIGDQNGWNNYDLCSEHYISAMKSLGVQRHNITFPPDGVPG